MKTNKNKLWAVLSVDVGEEAGVDCTASIVGLYRSKAAAKKVQAQAIKDFKEEAGIENDEGGDYGEPYMYDDETVLLADGAYGARFEIVEVSGPLAEI